MSRTHRAWVVSQGIALGVWRRAVPAAALLFIAFMLVQLFSFFAPGVAFLRYDDATAQPTFAGQAVPVELCRTRLSPFVGAIEAHATRTFYRADKLSGPFTSVGQYEFNPDIEDSDKCVSVPIKPEHFKHFAGYWKFHTDLTFTINGYDKTTKYDSNIYQVFPAQTNAQQQLQLQERIDDLQRQLDQLRADTNTTPAITRSSGNTNPTTPAATTSEPPEADAAGTNTPTQSAPQPAQPAALQAHPGVLQAIINGVVNLIP